MLRKSILLFGCALVITVFASASALACSCGGGGSPCFEYGRSTAVFVGTPISVRKEEWKREELDREAYYPPVTFKFTVEQSFLGPAGTEIEVSTGRGGGDCGYDFKVGTRYVVYAIRYPKVDRLITSTCSGTKPLAEANEDVAFLRSLGAHRPGVTIKGEVKRTRQNVATGNPTPVGPLGNLEVVIDGEGEHHEIRTDEQGRYSLTGLRPGMFTLKLRLPDELYTYDKERKITVADKGCATVHFYVVDNGRISGQLLGPEGQPVAGVLLTLMDAENNDPTKHQSRYAKTDADGNYTFDSLPPGRYLVAVNLTRFPDPYDLTNAYPRTYYPGVSEIAQAEAITLEAGEKISADNFKLTTRRAPSTLTGKVVWSDGTPVANAGIMFRDVTYHESASPYGIAADSQGYFTIKGFVGQAFVIEARSNRPYTGDIRRFEPMEKVSPVRIVLAKPTEELTIVITRLR